MITNRDGKKIVVHLEKILKNLTTLIKNNYLLNEGDEFMTAKDYTSLILTVLKIYNQFFYNTSRPIINHDNSTQLEAWKFLANFHQNIVEPFLLK